MPSRKASRKPAKKRITKTSKKKSAKLVKKPKLPILPLLILECDANRLASEGMAMGNQIHTIAQVLPVTNRNLELALINSQDDLRDAFVRYSERYRSIKVIVVIGHSDASGIRISTPHQTFLDWDVVAKWFQPFEPHYLVFAACKAGQYPSKSAFFDGLKKLKAIFASPVNISRLQVEIIKLLVPYLLLAKTLDPDAIALGQWFAFLRDKTIILYCRRRDSDWNKLIQFGAFLTALE
jgi:hypothetical protein